MTGGDLTYALLAVNPVGGLLAAVPWGVFEQHYSWALLLATGPLLGYVQVVIVDLAWGQLNRWAWWRSLLVGRRSPRVERLLQSRGAFVPVFLLTPIVGPWLVMACMRYARVPQRRVALPILASLFALTTVLVVVCAVAPRWLGR
jgi:hypothetical protein